MNAFLRKLRWLTERSDKEAELREELRFHLEEEAEQRQAAGLAADEAVSLVLLAVAALACFVSARRASRIDPMLALQHE